MSTDPLPELSPDELQRYHRHLILPSVGEEGQRRLKGAAVLLVGAGGLGSPAALYLAAAGVGRLGVVDADAVEPSNLQRQILYGTANVGSPKASTAATRVRELNPHVQVEPHPTRLTSGNALELLGQYDVIVDGSDNFQTRYLVNDACVLLGKPNVYGSVIRFDGQAAVFGGPGGPCYRCLFREPPPPGLIPNCAEGGVFGVLPGLVGVIQATEVIKLITGVGEPLVGRLLLVDALRMRFRTIVVERDPECRACGTREITALQDYDVFCGTSAAAVPAGERGVAADEDEITPRRLAERRRSGDPLVMIDVREPHEWAIARIENARLIPLDSLPRVANTLDRGAEIVVYCHHGMRSAAAAEWLRDQGFARVRNLVGGIDRWCVEVEPAQRRY